VLARVTARGPPADGAAPTRIGIYPHRVPTTTGDPPGSCDDIAEIIKRPRPGADA
jgi:hypothetical protein